MRPQIVKRAAALGAVFVLSASLGPHAGARVDGGSLDDSFSKDGKTRISFGSIEYCCFGNPTSQVSAQDVTKYRNGKLVLAGYAVDRFALTRLRSNGKLDACFGRKGRVTTRFDRRARADEVERYGSWKVVVGGTIGGRLEGIGRTIGHTGEGFALARYRGNGTLDKSFGEDGKVVTDLSERGNQLTYLAVQDEKIIVAGIFRDTVEDPDVPDNEYAIALRYNQDGTLDESFGDGGKVVATTPFYDYTQGDCCLGYLTTVVVAPDGKLIAVGNRDEGESSVSGFVVARYNADGTPDDSFGGGDGRVETPGEDDSDRYASSVAIQPDDKIIVGGKLQEGGCGRCFPYFHLHRYTSDGELDPTFSRDGMATQSVPHGGDAYSILTSLAVQPDGKILAAGYSQRDIEDIPEDRPTWRVDRYNADGSFDRPFGRDGVVRTKLAPGTQPAGVEVVALYPRGRIIAAGWATFQFRDERGKRAWRATFGVARYHR